MEPDERAKNDATLPDHSQENGAAEVTGPGDEERGMRSGGDAVDSNGIGVKQDSETGDDVDMDVSIIGARPVAVKFDTEIDQKGEIDQDTEVASDKGYSGGREIEVAAEQRPEVDQRIEVDVEVSEDDGIVVVEIDAEVEDDIEIESDLDVDVDNDDEDEDSLDTEIDQETATDGNLDVDVEIRDDLDAEVDVDIASLIDTAVLATADLAEKDEGTDIEVDLYEKAGVDGDVGVVVDLSDIDA